MTGSGPARLSPPPRMSGRKEFGDWQTPRGLVAAVLARLRADGTRFDRVFEPTCGRGHFLEAWIDDSAAAVELMGVEIQPEHAAVAQAVVGKRGQIVCADLFRLNLNDDLPWTGTGRLLIVGNPPWVTTAALGVSGGISQNPGPVRSNTKRVRGLEAMTGGSNFDLAEAVWLKLIRELASQQPTIALLCKASVARALLRSVGPEHLPITAASFWKIDASKWFGAAVSAGLLRVEVGPGPVVQTVPVFADLTALERESTWGLQKGCLIADLAAYHRGDFADGAGPIAWRQGVKHDVASVVELTPQPHGGWANGLGESVAVEAKHIYPWFKATDLARGIKPEPRRAVVMTQHTLADDPRALAQTSPLLWAYLQRHAARFAARKSSIYRGRLPFTLFGVGSYTFSPYKVAISGLHKSYRFRAIGPIAGRPPLVDDTCYFLPCSTAEAACTLAAVLNGPAAADLLRGLTFADSKRPITQAILKRFDLKALLDHAERGSLRQRAEAEYQGLCHPPDQDPAVWRLVWQDEWTTFPTDPVASA